MKVLAITIVICAVAFAAVPVPPKVPAELPIGANTTAPVNSTAPANSSVPVGTPAAREGRFLSLVSGLYYDRAYDVVLDRSQYYYVVNSPNYKITRELVFV